MEWRFTDDRPIWQQLTDQLTLSILKGEYPPGGRLPPVRELAAQAGVNPNTMQRALTQLESDGLAVANRTAGRVVTDDIAAIEAIRHRMAKEIVAKFYTAVGELGYSRQEAAALLKEEGSYE